MDERIEPAHPRDILLHDFLETLGISSYRLATDIGVQQTRIGRIVQFKRAVTAQTALLLARYFGTNPEFWLELQDRYDLELLHEEMADRLARIEPVRHTG